MGREGSLCASRNRERQSSGPRATCLLVMPMPSDHCLNQNHQILCFRIWGFQNGPFRSFFSFVSTKSNSERRPPPTPSSKPAFPLPAFLPPPCLQHYSLSLHLTPHSPLAKLLSTTLPPCTASTLLLLIFSSSATPSGGNEKPKATPLLAACLTISLCRALRIPCSRAPSVVVSVEIDIACCDGGCGSGTPPPSSSSSSSSSSSIPLSRPPVSKPTPLPSRSPPASSTESTPKTTLSTSAHPSTLPPPASSSKRTKVFSISVSSTDGFSRRQRSEQYFCGVLLFAFAVP